MKKIIVLSFLLCIPIFMVAQVPTIGFDPIVRDPQTGRVYQQQQEPTVTSRVAAYKYNRLTDQWQRISLKVSIYEKAGSLRQDKIVVTEYSSNGYWYKCNTQASSINPITDKELAESFEYKAFINGEYIYF